MRLLFVILLSIITTFGFGQSVTAPEPKSFAINTIGQDASGFVLSGFNATETLLASISLINPPSGTTFYLNTTTGLTAASGFTLNGNKTRLVVTGTIANVNTALASLKVNTGSVVGNVQLSVAATINPIGFFYNGVNGHFYKPLTATADRTTYTNARARSLLSTFKGQSGYLVTITSTSEEEFIRVNVPATNVWFAATDEVVDGRWVIDAGPEKGTVMKTANGQLNGNIVGVYNNWCGGEPNGSNGSENYAVAKWNGAACWNDLSNNWNNPYVIEYGTWTNPDDQTFTEFYSNSVIHSNGDVFRVQYTFNFNNLTASRFALRTHSQSNNVWTPFSQNYTSLNNIGRVDMSSFSDTIKVVGGISANINSGQVEYSYTNPNASWLNGDSRLLIDMRTFGNTVPSTISRAKILDTYDGPVTYLSSDAAWAQYRVPSPLTKVTDGTSIYNANIRNVNGWNTDYAFTSTISFSNQMVYKPQMVQFQNPIADTITSMLDRIVTVSDVYLAFKEFADGGIFGNTSNYFTSGIQFMNADVDENGQFNEADCFKLLRHLLGQESLLTTNNLQSFIKLLPKSDYDAVTKSNWMSYPNATSDSYSNLTLSSTQLLNAFTLNAFWKGDVNMSHSPSQTVTNGVANQINSITSMSNSISKNSSEPSAYVISEIIGDSLVVIVKFNPNTNDIVGTQFRINYDNSILKYSGTQFKTAGSPINFGNDRGDNINLGSLNMSGGILDNTTEYKLSFKLNKKITNSLGLVSIATNEAVTKMGGSIKIRIE
jgi:hypothetical protein